MKSLPLYRPRGYNRLQKTLYSSYVVMYLYKKAGSSRSCGVTLVATLSYVKYGYGYVQDGIVSVCFFLKQTNGTLFLFRFSPRR